MAYPDPPTSEPQFHTSEKGEHTYILPFNGTQYIGLLVIISFWQRPTAGLSCSLLPQLTIDQVGMVTALSQLHHGVDEIGHVVLICALGQEGKVLLQNGTVVLFLDIGQLYFNDRLLFGSKVLFHIIF